MKKNGSAKIDFRSWLVTILGVIVLIAIASHVYETIPSSSAYGDPPAFFDWRDHQGKNWMTSVKDQGSCKVCGIFAFIGAMEAVANVEAYNPNLDLDLSEQHIVSCAINDACELGIESSDVLDFLIFNGTPDELCFPYTATSGDCSDTCNHWENRLMFVQDYSITPFNNNYDSSVPASEYNSLTKQHLIQKGPLMVAMQWQGHFVNDIYFCEIDLIPSESEEAVPNNPYHGVVMVGYNDIGKYWIMKNQWGDDWPPPSGDGYFKVGYDSGCLFRKVYSVSGIHRNIMTPTPVSQKVRITNDDNWDGDPVVRDNQIVWSKGDSSMSFSEKDVYYLKVPEEFPPNYAPVPIAITNDDINQITPTICGSVVYYSENGTIMYCDLKKAELGEGNSYGYHKLCTDEMRAEGRCTGWGYQADCCSSAVTFVRPFFPPYPLLVNDIVRFNLNDSVHYREKIINGPSYDHQPQPTSDNWPDSNKRPQINVDGLRIVYSESIDDYLQDKFQAYYYDGIPPQIAPFPPELPEFPKFVDKNISNNQFNVDLEGNIIVWAQAGEYYGANSNIHIKDLVNGSHTIISRAGAQTMPVISGGWVVFFDGVYNDIVLYNIEDHTQHAITDRHESSSENIRRKGLDFQGDTIVWGESSDTEAWDIYMFKIIDES